MQGHAGVGLVPGGPDGGLVARLWAEVCSPAPAAAVRTAPCWPRAARSRRMQGATLALVKGRVETSGPILRRAGFATYGQERCYEARPVPGAGEPSPASTAR